MEEENKIKPSEEDISYTTNTPAQSESEELSPAIPQENVATASIENEEEFVKPKKSLFMKILFGVIAFLLLLLITGFILYFSGFFEHKEEPKKVEEQHVVQEAPAKPEPVVENTTKFEIKNINSKKLNEQLANLTNKNLPEDKKTPQNNKVIEKEKTQEMTQEKEEIKDNTQKEKVTIEASPAEEKKNQENDVTSNNSSQIQNDTIHNNAKDLKIEKDKENPTNSQFLLFINVAKIKGVLYKKYLDKITAINPNVRLCRDEKNRIEIYFGPFEKNEDRSDVLDKLLKNKFTEAYSVEFTKEEFDKRCNY
jgi:hypothetical protein